LYGFRSATWTERSSSIATVSGSASSRTKASGLNARERTGNGAGGAVIAFQPQDGLEQAVSRLREEGVEFPGDISEHPWGRVAAFKDPDGNDLQFYEPPK
jgi:predicted enzyme related to lactoylglutathione lyase